MQRIAPLSEHHGPPVLPLGVLLAAAAGLAVVVAFAVYVGLERLSCRLAHLGEPARFELLHGCRVVR